MLSQLGVDLVALPLGKKIVLPLALFLFRLLHFLLPPTTFEFLRTCLDQIIIIDVWFLIIVGGFGSTLELNSKRCTKR